MLYAITYDLFDILFQHLKAIFILCVTTIDCPFECNKQANRGDKFAIMLLYYPFVNKFLEQNPS